MNSYVVTYKLTSNSKIITKTYHNITPETLKKYIDIYTSFSKSTYVSHTTLAA